MSDQEQTFSANFVLTIIFREKKIQLTDSKAKT